MALKPLSTWGLWIQEAVMLISEGENRLLRAVALTGS